MNLSLFGAMKTRRTLALALGALALVLVGVFLVFKHEEPPQAGARPPPISEACWEQLNAQQQLGLLAVRSMETYGRIDPGLFELNSDAREIRISPEAKPIAVPGDEPVRRFQAALQAVNAVPALVQRFREGAAEAVQACGGDCPPSSYDINVQLVVEPKNPDAGFYTWHVNGVVPTNKEWQQGFLALYGGAPKLSCPEYAVLDLTSKNEEKVTSADRPEIRQMELANKKKDPAGRDIADGSAATASGCSSKTHHSCDLCWITSTIPGGFYSIGSKWCCGDC